MAIVKKGKYPEKEYFKKDRPQKLFIKEKNRFKQNKTASKRKMKS